MVLRWLRWEAVANCLAVPWRFAELLDCQGRLTDRIRKSRVPRPRSFVPRCGGYRHAVAGCCQPERRSGTLANLDRRDTTGCFGPRATLTGYPQAVTRGSEPDRRSRSLGNCDSQMMPRCLDSGCTVAAGSPTNRRRVLPRNRSRSVRAARWRAANIRK